MLQKNIIIQIVIAFFCINTFAQNVAITEAQMLYDKEYQLGVNANTHGMGGITFRYGWHKTGTKTNMFETELAIIQHPKEYKQSPANTNIASQYKYGKLNNVFFLRTGYGSISNLTERTYKNALGLNLIYAAGINFALLKPYYFDVNVASGGRTQPNVTAALYSPTINDIDYVGSSSFVQGLGETSLKLGAYGRVALAVEWGQYPDEYKTLEAGITLDGFGDGIPILYGYNAEQYFLGLYLAFNWAWKK